MHPAWRGNVYRQHCSTDRFQSAQHYEMAQVRCTSGPTPSRAATEFARYFQEYLSQRWSAVVVRGRDLYDEIKRRGYTGSFSNLERFLTTWRRATDASKDIARLALSITTSSVPPRVLDPAAPT
jgi:hypothetical protein